MVGESVNDTESRTVEQILNSEVVTDELKDIIIWDAHHPQWEAKSTVRHKISQLFVGCNNDLRLYNF